MLRVPDIVSRSPPASYIVVGWFTPDYLPVAQRFAVNLSSFGAPYHLFAKDSVGAWNTLRKPDVVLEAIQLYPDKTIILMDIDCIVHETVEPISRLDCDIGIVLRGLSEQQHKNHISLWACSRVLVVKPTEAARKFIEQWQRLCRGSAESGRDEYALLLSFLYMPNVKFAHVPLHYSAREVGELPDPIVAHLSEHAKRKPRSSLKELLRMIERPFRSGRTRKRRIASELPLGLTASSEPAPVRAADNNPGPVLSEPLDA